MLALNIVKPLLHIFEHLQVSEWGDLIGKPVAIEPANRAPKCLSLNLAEQQEPSSPDHTSSLSARRAWFARSSASKGNMRESNTVVYRPELCIESPDQEGTMALLLRQVLPENV